MLDKLIQHLHSSTQPQHLTGLRGSAASLACALSSGSTKCTCIVVPDEHYVALYEQDLKLFTNKRVIGYSGYEIPPYTPLSPDQRTTASRISSLHLLLEMAEPFILVISIEALLRKVVPPAVFHDHAELVMEEEDCDTHELIAQLESMGYERVELVQNMGDYSVRGGILDIYPPPFPLANNKLNDTPLRLDFFGDTIENIRCFNPVNQRSYDTIPEAVFLPVHDILLPKAECANTKKLVRIFEEKSKENRWDQDHTYTIVNQLKNGQRFAGCEFFLPLFFQDYTTPISSVFDYLPEDSVIWLSDTEAISQNLKLVHERIHSNYLEASNAGKPALPPADIFLLEEHVRKQLAKYRCINISELVSATRTTLDIKSSNHNLLKQNISLQRKKRGLLAPLSDQIKQWHEQQESVVLCCRSDKRAKHLAEMLSKYHHTTQLISPPFSMEQLCSQNGDSAPIFLCNQPLSSGFSLLEDKVHYLSENELFGEMRLGTKTKQKFQKGEPVRFTEIRKGDIIVHRDHGLGKYVGLATMEFNSVTNDFLLLEYRDGDKLYLPVDRLNLVSKYQGLSDQQPKIDKLGTTAWKSIKAKIKEEVWKVAQELLDIYAKREIVQGTRFTPPGEMYHELEESFPFDETPGQGKAITETINDLTSDKVTDRLICGDVGYGKTEVAIRAAFKVVEDGFQAAVLVPTTVLAEQHAKTFQERLEGFPITVSCINRFRTASEQKTIIRELKEKKIDILIGTHRLLSKDIQFSNLGLLIVDEEHRFGVSHKEKIKKLRAHIDILTLTATPIPRTLQMSLLGIRDLSVISSPPEHRRPVKTFVAEYDDLVIKEGITRELRRNGQVFFVHNRVKSIHRTADKIQQLVPQARIAVAHGQMGGKELEDIMVSFVNKEVDVLICTTIIESGLDIPAANTIIIDRADRLGLAEIYQLRGRVGRSSQQSFAYLLVPSLDALSKDSRERLRALMDYNELGGGFKLAMSDLQIRGGGNLLGVSQSGNIAAIGYDLYLDLLQKTVADLKARKNDGGFNENAEELEPEINLQISAYIPQHYIHDISQRYIMYRRIAALSQSEENESVSLVDELEDRYGALPQETANLFRMVAIKKYLIKLQITKLEKGPGNLVFTFSNTTPVRPDKLMNYIQEQGKNTKRIFKLTPDGRLVVSTTLDNAENIFLQIEHIKNTLIQLTEEHDKT